MSRLAVLTVLLAACGSASPRPPAPVAGAPADSQHAVGADVAFMLGMIAHHAQALAMAQLAPSRASRENIKLLAERIRISQITEIERMQQWLKRRGVASDHSHAHMPGMIDEADMRRLAAASGADFDRLFLEFMIGHHEGALVMVRELFAGDSGPRDPLLFTLASDIDADQRAEIARMQTLLESFK